MIKKFQLLMAFALISSALLIKNAQSGIILTIMNQNSGGQCSRCEQYALRAYGAATIALVGGLIAGDLPGATPLIGAFVFLDETQQSDFLGEFVEQNLGFIEDQEIIEEVSSALNNQLSIARKSNPSTSEYKIGFSSDFINSIIDRSDLDQNEQKFLHQFLNY
jgi:hypothetical protein